jgi:hypothetical protein
VTTAEDSSNIRNFKGASQQQRDLIDADTFGTNTPFSAYQFEASVRLPFGRIHATSTLISQASRQTINPTTNHRTTSVPSFTPEENSSQDSRHSKRPEHSGKREQPVFMLAMAA